MPESEFDKHVQQEMEGLRLRPSAAVWENVEKELRRKKRRRVVVFFWLLAGLGLLGYSGYLFTKKGGPVLAESSSPAGKLSTGSGQSPQTPGSSDDRTQQPVDAANGKGQASSTTTAPAGETTSHAAPSANTSGTTGNDATNTNNNDRVTNNRTKKLPPAVSADQPPAAGMSRQDRRNNGYPVTASRKNLAGRKDQAAGKLVRNQPKKKVPATAAPDETGGEEIAAVSQQPSPVNQPALNSQPAAPNTEGALTDSVKTAIDSAVAKVKEPAATPAVTTRAKKQPASSKIKWSLDLGFGYSGPIGSPFLLGNSEKNLLRDAGVAQNGMYNPVFTPGNAGSFGPVYIPRSDIKPGPAARIGILGEWPVSKRSSIVSGLQYQYQSNNIRTGFYKDTSLVFNNYASTQVSVRSLYQGAQQKTFTNRFHYLQVPFTFQWQMNNGKKLPIFLSAGFTAGYLITTNGLLYDSLQGGIYYHDKKAFNRFQLSFNTGLSFRFGNAKALQWSVGPEFSMGMRRLIKEEYDKKQFPLYLGVQGRIYLPKARRR